MLFQKHSEQFIGSHSKEILSVKCQDRNDSRQELEIRKMLKRMCGKIWYSYSTTKQITVYNGILFNICFGNIQLENGKTKRINILCLYYLRGSTLLFH